MQTRYHEKATLLMSAPGIGRTLAMLFLLEVGDISRFKGFDPLNDLIGFCPDTDSSGDTVRDRGITTRRHKTVTQWIVAGSLAGNQNRSRINGSLSAINQKNETASGYHPYCTKIIAQNAGNIDKRNSLSERLNSMIRQIANQVFLAMRLTDSKRKRSRLLWLPFTIV